MDSQGPAKVTGITASPAINTITLRWQDVPDNDFSYFGIEQKNPADGTFKRIATENQNLGYHVLNLTPNTEYTFRVNGYDIYDNPGEYSDEITVSTNDDAILPNVTSIRPMLGYYASSIPVSVTATDNVGVREVWLETSVDKLNWKLQATEVIGSPKTSVSVSRTIIISDIPEGSLFIRAFAMDIQGNVSPHFNAVYNVRKEPSVKDKLLKTLGLLKY